MEIGQNGFLATMYSLRALPKSFFDELKLGEDLNQAAPGELLTVNPATCGSTGTECDSCPSRRSFVGADTGGKCTIARIVEMPGQELLDRFLASKFVSLNVPCFSDEAWVHHLITVSGKLCPLREETFARIVWHGNDYCIYPYGGRPPVEEISNIR